MFALIGNKLDLESNRKVTFEEGKKLAEKNNYVFQEVSAKTGDNFEKLFEVQIFEAVYNKFKNIFKSLLIICTCRIYNCFAKDFSCSSVFVSLNNFLHSFLFLYFVRLHE